MSWALRSLALMAGLLLAACAAQTTAGGDATQPASFVVAPGEQFDIRLEANPSTGFQWRIGEPPDEAVVKLVGSDFQRGSATAEAGAPPALPSGEPVERVGQGGVETWRFAGVAPGRTRIELVYGRPWESDKVPARFAVYSVDVR